VNRSHRPWHGGFLKALVGLVCPSPLDHVNPPHSRTEAKGRGTGLIRAVLALAIGLAARSVIRRFRSRRPLELPTAQPLLPDPAPQVRQRRRVTETRVRKIIGGILETALLTLFVFFLVRSVADTFRVSGASMEPTLQGGQLLGVNKLVYAHVDGTALEGLVPSTRQGSVEYVFGGPRRGDIAVFRLRLGRNRAVVKRIIGLPGDAVLIDQGRVFVNGQPVDEPYLRFAQGDETYPEDGEPVEVPDGRYFVLGDNRHESSDSREDWFVPVEYLVGRAWVSYWPPATWGRVS
jgi:signal peptidase I